MDESLVVRSPAKINLTLCVLGQRADGYHELDTTLLALDRFDSVGVRVVEGSGRVRVAVEGSEATADIPRDESNLAARGAALALRVSGAAYDVELRLDKSIPSRAGLGGGSSNAAAACYGTAHLLGVDASGNALLEGLARIGSDCSFFLRARATGHARCTGHGEVVTPLSLPPSERAFVVVTPEVGCATAEVYAAGREEDRGTPFSGDPDIWFRAPLTEARDALQNDLEAAALRTQPSLNGFRKWLDGVGGAHFRLSGSGSSFFGLFEDRASAEAFLEQHCRGGKARDHGLRCAFVARPAGADREA